MTTESTESSRVFKRVCKKCGKEIYSLYERQADYNLKQHLLTHTEAGAK